MLKFYGRRIILKEVKDKLAITATLEEFKINQRCILLIKLLKTAF